MLKKTKRAFVTLASAAVVAATIGWSSPASASEPFLGQITMFGGNFAPRGWALCDGQLLQISQNSALFSILGTTFGGDGRTSFALPDLRGRIAMHPGSGPGLPTVRLGERSGTHQIQLTTNNMPSHNHTATAHGTDQAGDVEVPGTPGDPSATPPIDPTHNIWAKKARNDDYSTLPDVDDGSGGTVPAPVVDMHPRSVTIGNTGSGQSFSIQNPFLGINHIIALTGLFPSRN